jgi:hypothetical protein
MIDLESLTNEEAALIATIRLARRKYALIDDVVGHYRPRVKVDAKALRKKVINQVDMIITKPEEE